MPEMREHLCRFQFICLSMYLSVSKYILIYICYLYVSTYAYTNMSVYVYAYLLEAMPEMREQLCRFLLID